VYYGRSFSHVCNEKVVYFVTVWKTFSFYDKFYSALWWPSSLACNEKVCYCDENVVCFVSVRKSCVDFFYLCKVTAIFIYFVAAHVVV
jgi:hypothetical protein